MRRRDAMGLIGSALALAGCWGGNTWHQKMTVTINTPNGVVQGSSVTEVNWLFRDDGIGLVVVGDRKGAEVSLRGEGVVVEIEPGKVLMALLDEAQQRLAFEVFFPKKVGALKGHYNSPNLEHAREIEKSKMQATVPPDLYPLLVTFSDVNDPTSVKVVKPEDMAATFGSGYSLKSITLEITDEEVTSGVVKKLLTWLATLSGRVKPIREPIPPGYAPTAEEKLYSNSFIRRN